MLSLSWTLHIGNESVKNEFNVSLITFTTGFSIQNPKRMRKSSPLLLMAYAMLVSS